MHTSKRGLPLLSLLLAASVGSLVEPALAADAAAARAKAYASEAFTRIGIDGVQLHEAIGFTAEYDIQLYLKRSKWALPAFGDAEFHFERVTSLGGF